METLDFVEPSPAPLDDNEADRLRREFDATMVDRVRSGFIPAEDPKARVIDGTLSPDAKDALEQLWLTNERGVRMFARRISALTQIFLLQ